MDGKLPLRPILNPSCGARDSDDDDDDARVGGDAAAAIRQAARAALSCSESHLINGHIAASTDHGVLELLHGRFTAMLVDSCWNLKNFTLRSVAGCSSFSEKCGCCKHFVACMLANGRYK